MAEPSTDAFSSDSGPVPFVDDMPREGSSMPYFPTKDTQKKPANIASIVGDDDDARRNIIAGETKLTEKQIGFEGAQQRQQDMRDNQYRERMERMVSAEGTTADDLKPWNAEQELAEHKTDLWSQFGSPGFIISMLASAFTAQPMNTALTAGAAAMNAINQGDMNAYNKAFDVWKENTNLTLKRLNLEHEQFADIDKLRQTDMAAWRTKAELLMRQFGDERKLMLLQNGMDPDLDKILDGQWKAREDLANAQQVILKNKVLMDTLNGHPDPNGDHKDAKGNPMSGGDPRWYKGTDQIAAYTDAVKRIQEAERAGFRGGTANARSFEEIKQDVMREHPEYTPGQADQEAFQRMKASQAAPMTGNQRYKVEEHLGLYDDALKIIDGVESTLNRYVGAAGAAGKVTRTAERVRDILGSNDTDRVQMMRDIEQLQLMGPRLLLDQATGRPLSSEAGHINDIIAGLSMGDTTANTLRAMKEIKERLQVIRDRGRSNLPGNNAPAAGPHVDIGMPQVDQGWDAFPEAK